MTNNSTNLEQGIRKLTYEELNSADKQYGPFHSQHEGYAVLKEEVEELLDSAQRCSNFTEVLWKLIKQDSNSYSRKTQILAEIRKHATATAAEAIQVAAMCHKFGYLLVKEERSIESSSAE